MLSFNEVIMGADRNRRRTDSPENVGDWADSIKCDAIASRMFFTLRGNSFQMRAAQEEGELTDNELLFDPIKGITMGWVIDRLCNMSILERTGYRNVFTKLSDGYGERNQRPENLKRMMDIEFRRVEKERRSSLDIQERVDLNQLIHRSLELANWETYYSYGNVPNYSAELHELASLLTDFVVERLPLPTGRGQEVRVASGEIKGIIRRFLEGLGRGSSRDIDRLEMAWSQKVFEGVRNHSGNIKMINEALRSESKPALRLVP